MSDALTLDEIEQLLGEVKTRGEYKPFLSRFFESGDVSVNISENFPGKVAASLKGAVYTRLKQDFQSHNYKLMVVNVRDEDGEIAKDDEGNPLEQVLLVNMDAYLAARAGEQQVTSVED